MKQIICFFVILPFLVKLYAQSYTDNYSYLNTSLETVTTPASIAMGESFVANPKNVSSFLENPATLSGSREIGLFYNYRSHDWIDYAKSFNYSSAGLTTKSSWGNIGFHYSQFSTGLNAVDIYGDGKSPNDVNKTFSLSISCPIFPNLYLGLSAKIFSHDRTGSNSSANLESNNAFLIDLGILLKIFHFETSELQHEFNLGAVAQNFGTDYKEKDNYLSDQFRNVRLPRYFKIGFAYNLQMKNSNGSNDFEATVTAQYKNYLNPEYETPDVDYWGAGVEATILNIFTIRMGMIQFPEYWLFYDRATPILRYGFGLNLPFEKLGFRIPLTISADYAFIPLKEVTFNDFQNRADVGKTGKMMHAIGISLRYNNLLF